MTQITAYCYRSGLIGFCLTGQMPPDTRPLATGPEKRVREIVEVLATHCWDGKTRRVGGMATAESNEGAETSYLWFRDMAQRALARPTAGASHG